LSYARRESSIAARVVLQDRTPWWPQVFDLAKVFEWHSGCDVPCVMIGRKAMGEEHRMNWDRIEGNWKQLKGKVKEQWGKLTDDDIGIRH
jgi:hypothetical protein